MLTMLGLESALRGCLSASDSTRLQQLIDQAQERGLIDEGGAAALHKVRKLRNKISHHAVSFDVPPAALLQWIEALQDAVSDIYARAAAEAVVAAAVVGG